MRRFYRGLFIVWVALRYGLDELVLSSFQKPWLRVVTRIVSFGRNLDAPRGQRLREARNFSHALADALGSSRWLSERIMLDLSGQQLGTALMALGVNPADGQFMLAQLYPHLNASIDGKNRAQVLWQGLDPERCDERMLAWLRADDEAEGRGAPMADAANANDEAAHPASVERPVFGRRRAAGTRR